jgi:hypothetical protein
MDHPEPSVDSAAEGPPSRPRSARRITLAAALMVVLTAATGSALFVKVVEHAPTSNDIFTKFDAGILLTGAIALTAIALGSLKRHNLVQILLQATLSFFGVLTIIWLAEGEHARALAYWFQSCFLLTVVIPSVARRIVGQTMPRGPRRQCWKNTLEAVIFSFVNLMLVLAGWGIQFLAVGLIESFA